MRAGAHRDALPVDHHRHVMGMNALQFEGDDRALARRIAEDAQRVDGAQPLMRIGLEVGLMRGDALAADRFHVVERGTQPDRLDDRRRAGLEAVRRVVVGDAVLGHLLDHLAAALKGRMPFEHVLLAVEHADARRAVDLVAGEDEEVAVEVLHVDRHVHGALAAVDQHRNATRMRDAHDLLDRRDRAQRIRHLGDGDQLGAVGQALLEFLDVEDAEIVDRHPDQLGALPLADEMPGHDVGVVLHDRQHDLVALADIGHAIAIGDRVDRRGRVRGEDDVVGARRIEEAAHRFARLLIGVGRGIGQEMQAAMDVGVFLANRRAGSCRAPPAASAPRRRCRDRPAACRRLPATGSGSRGGSPRRRRDAPILSIGMPFIQSVHPCVPCEPVVEPRFQRLDDRLVVQFLDHLGDERLDQQAARASSRRCRAPSGRTDGCGRSR